MNNEGTTATGQNPAPLFIVGCDRSGTTLLRLMLMQSREICIPHETSFIADLRLRSDDYGDFSTDWQKHAFIRDLQWQKATSKTIAFDSFGLTTNEVYEAISRENVRDYAGAVRAVYEAHAEKYGKCTWGDKTPKYILDMDWLSTAFADAKFVHILRDARDVSASLMKARFQRDMKSAAMFWVERVSAGRRSGEQLPPDRYYEIRYENLVLNPEQELRKLCQWAGLEYSAAMLAYYKDAKENLVEQHVNLFELANKPADPSRAYAWKKNMAKSDIADVEASAGDLLRSLEYEIAGFRSPMIVQMTRKLTRFARSYMKKNPWIRDA